MSASEKDSQSSNHVEQVSPDIEGLGTLRGVAALEVAQRIEPPIKSSKSMIQMYALCGTIFLCATIGGYDASLTGVMLDLPYFQSQFGATIIGVKAGLISSMFFIGSVSALPFIGPANDIGGRRYGIFIGCILIIMGAIIQGTSHHIGQYLAGRFFLGFGSGVASSGPAYIVELAHPVYRGVIAGTYNSCYYLGSFLAAIVLRGCLGYQSNQSWLIPTWFQVVFPAILASCILFFPESPRWLYSHGHVEECRAILIKYHGNGNPDSVYVKLQMREFEEELRPDGSDKRWWDYRELFNSRASLYRVILCSAAVYAFSQWTGQAGISYFLPGMLATTGITATKDVMDINIGIAVTSGIAAVIGGSLIERLGRRKMLISCCIALAFSWVAMLVCTQQYYANLSVSAAKASVFFIYLIGVIFSLAYTPLQQLYPAECLAFEQRAKGSGFVAMTTSGAALVNFFATPIALQKITWKTNGIWIATCTLQAVYYYFFMVETKGHTLEEMSWIFKQKNPRDASLIDKKATAEAVTMVQDVTVREVVHVQAGVSKELE
jgi:sugar porter (SP) family MFS transporter